MLKIVIYVHSGYVNFLQSFYIKSITSLKTEDDTILKVLWNFIGVYLGFCKNIMTVKGNEKWLLDLFNDGFKYDKNIIKYLKDVQNYLAINIELSF